MNHSHGDMRLEKINKYSLLHRIQGRDRNKANALHGASGCLASWNAINVDPPSISIIFRWAMDVEPSGCGLYIQPCWHFICPWKLSWRKNLSPCAPFSSRSDETRKLVVIVALLQRMVSWI